MRQIPDNNYITLINFNTSQFMKDRWTQQLP